MREDSKVFLDGVFRNDFEFVKLFDAKDPIDRETLRLVKEGVLKVGVVKVE